MTNKITALVGIDVETTGLEEDDTIIEIAWRFLHLGGSEIVSPLRPEGYVLRHEYGAQRYDALKRMLLTPEGKVPLEMHLSTGLLRDALDHQTGERPVTVLREFRQDLAQAERELHSSAEVPIEIEWRLFGSSVHFDRGMLERDPVLRGILESLTHRNFDLSTIRPVLKALRPDDFKRIERLEPPAGSGKRHRAAWDIERDAIQWRAMFQLLEGAL